MKIKKRGKKIKFSEILNSKPVIGALIFIMLSLVTVLAGNVIVKEGDSYFDGKVGINTTTPQNTLNVIGDINFTGLIYGNGSQLTDIGDFDIAEWQSLCTDCVGNSDLAANSVDLTSDALSTAYAGVGIGGGGASALSFAAADVDGTCLTGSGTTLSVTANCIGNTQLQYDTGQHLTTGTKPTFAGVNLGGTTYYLGSSAAASKLYTLAINEIYADLGGATDPSYTFTGDTNTGMYAASADRISFATGGFHRLMINNAGVEVITDHTYAGIDKVVNVVYHTTSCPTASTTTIGTLCVIY